MMMITSKKKSFWAAKLLLVVWAIAGNSNPSFNWQPQWSWWGELHNAEKNDEDLYIDDDDDPPNKGTLTVQFQFLIFLFIGNSTTLHCTAGSAQSSTTREKVNCIKLHSIALPGTCFKIALQETCFKSKTSLKRVSSNILLSSTWTIAKLLFYKNTWLFDCTLSFFLRKPTVYLPLWLWLYRFHFWSSFLCLHLFFLFVLCLCLCLFLCLLNWAAAAYPSLKFPSHYRLLSLYCILSLCFSIFLCLCLRRLAAYPSIELPSHYGLLRVFAATPLIPSTDNN